MSGKKLPIHQSSKRMVIDYIFKYGPTNSIPRHAMPEWAGDAKMRRILLTCQNESLIEWVDEKFSLTDYCQKLLETERNEKAAISSIDVNVVLPPYHPQTTEMDPEKSPYLKSFRTHRISENPVRREHHSAGEYVEKFHGAEFHEIKVPEQQ